MEYDLDAMDMEVLQEAKNLMKARWPDLVKGYLGDAARYIDGIKQGLCDGDGDVVSFNAHSLKSSSLSLGVKSLGDFASVIEGGARDFVENGKDMAYLNGLVPLVEDAFQRAVKKLEGTIA